VGLREDRKEVRTDRNWRAACLGAESHEFAVGAVVAHHVLKLSDSGEGGAAGVVGDLASRRVDRQPDLHPHVNLGIVDALERRGGVGLGRPTCEYQEDYGGSLDGA
jgi:hypothetical protein